MYGESHSLQSILPLFCAISTLPAVVLVGDPLLLVMLGGVVGCGLPLPYLWGQDGYCGGPLAGFGCCPALVEAA